MFLTSAHVRTCVPAVIVGLCCVMNEQAPAVPPSPHPIEAVQPDGAKIKLYLRGTAKNNWYEDENGFTVVRGPSRYVYALRGPDGRLVSSGLLVGKVNPKDAGLMPGIRPSAEAIERLNWETLPRHNSGAALPPKAASVPASPHVVEAVQPDGARIKLRLRGYEKLHWYEDPDGYTVIEEPGNFVYATLGSDGGLRPTDLVVGKVDPAKSGLQRRIRPSQTTDD